MTSDSISLDSWKDNHSRKSAEPSRNQRPCWQTASRRQEKEATTCCCCECKGIGVALYNNPRLGTENKAWFVESGWEEWGWAASKEVLSEKVRKMATYFRKSKISGEPFSLWCLEKVFESPGERSGEEVLAAPGVMNWINRLLWEPKARHIQLAWQHMEKGSWQVTQLRYHQLYSWAESSKPFSKRTLEKTQFCNTLCKSCVIFARRSS